MRVLIVAARQLQVAAAAAAAVELDERTLQLFRVDLANWGRMLRLRALVLVRRAAADPIARVEVCAGPSWRLKGSQFAAPNGVRSLFRDHDCWRVCVSCLRPPIWERVS